MVGKDTSVSKKGGCMAGKMKEKAIVIEDEKTEDMKAFEDFMEDQDEHTCTCRECTQDCED